MSNRLATTISIPRSARPAALLHRIVLNGNYLLITVVTLVLTLLALLCDIGDSTLETSYLVALGALCSSMFSVRALYVRAERFIFSPSFWLLVTFFFYFVLKSMDIWSKDDITPTLIEALWLCTLFLAAYVVSYALVDAHVRGRVRQFPGGGDMVIAPGAHWTLLAIYAGFKFLGIALFASVGGDVLEVSAATQNAGAAYLYRIPALGTIVLLALLYDAVKHRRGVTVVALALGLHIAEAVLSTSRLSLVLVAMWSAFLYHRYRHPISLSWVALIGLPLLLIVVLFGYARNIEVGSASAYGEAASVLMAEPSLISDLFMQRMDMLPELVAALDLHRNDVLPNLSGASYIYAFMHSIPRSLWEAKPLLTAALVTSETHPGAFADGVNIFPSIIFEGMLNLSYAGVVFAGALIAFLCRQMERAIDADRLVPSVWALSMLTFPMGLFNEGVHSNFTGNLLYLTALTAMFYAILRKIGLIRRQRVSQ